MAALMSSAMVVLGCAPYPLHANMTDAKIDATLAANFQPGMTRAQVDDKLSELRVSSKWRLWFEPPPRMIVRLWQPGGFWVNDNDQTVEWVDVLYQFDDSHLLKDWKTKRDQMRYVGGRPYYWKYDGPPRDFPIPPPPPKEWAGDPAPH
jgi:hypothetical protein